MSDRQKFILLFFAAFLLRVVLIALSPWHSDLEILRAWGVKANLNGITNIYQHFRHYPVPGYPPLAPYLMWFFDHMAIALHRFLPGMDGFAWTYKLFLAFTDCLIGWALYRKLSDSGNNTFGAFLFLFNPGVLYCGVIWGQLDNVYTLFLLLALIALTANQIGFAGALYGLACLTKIQAAVFAPLFLFAVLRRNSWRAVLPFGLFAALLFIIGCLPFVLTGQMGAVLACFRQSDTLCPYLSMNAFNLWWLLSGGSGLSPDNAPFVFSLTAKSVGLTLFSLATLAALLTVVRHEGKAGARQEDSGLVLSFSLLAFAFFMLPTQMHERYLFPFFAFLPLLPLSSILEKGLYALCAVSYYINMNAVFHAHRHWTGFWTDHFAGIGMVCAAVNLAAFALLLGMALKKRN
ncbi:MAG: hypothetical protein V1913_06880 [Fibrobacterota bacterium]